jgi:RHS repeat-associated protein
MMKNNRIAVVVVLVLLGGVVTLGAATQPKFRSSGSDPGPGRYLVTLAGDGEADDPAVLRQELAALYGARLDAGVPAGVRQFAVTMTAARARLLSNDPRVSEVAEAPSTQPPAPSSVSSPRHFTVQTTGYGDNGQSGSYSYDSSGNITSIGTDAYLYDAEARLTVSQTRSVTESYTYDAFGNRTTATGAVNCLGQSTCAQPVAVDTSTNRLQTINGGSVQYDSAGNVTDIAGVPSTHYVYDGTAMMTQATVGSDDRQYVYTADDERIAVKQGVSWTWTVRDMSQKVLREFTSMETGGSNFAMTNRTWVKDYVWRDGLLLATTSSGGTLDYHLDHLGTPRLVTDVNQVKVAEHAYYPFGAEINLTPHETPEEAMKFTGHERDTVAGDGHTLDYMHARYYSPTAGRFVSVDPALDLRKALPNPQAWNRYAYVRNNPVRFTDPTGKYTCSGSKDDCRAIDTAVADLTAAASKLPKDSSDRSRLNNVIIFLGAANTDNGVHVVVGSGTLPGAAGGTLTANGITTIGIDMKGE